MTLSNVTGRASAMMRKIPVTLLGIALLFGCTVRPKALGPDHLRQGHPPQILDYHAEQTISPGASWKLYLKLQDVDCDMTYLIAQVWQAGVGAYPASFTPVGTVGCHEVSGYVSLRTPPDRDLIGDRLEATLLVRDKNGNNSGSIKLLIHFDMVPAAELPEQWQAAATRSFGTIRIDVVSSSKFTRQGG
jgi:hypothetical protein